MKIFVYFILTLLFSAGCLFGAMNARNPFPLFGVAFGIWAFFCWRYRVHTKREEARRAKEQLFENYMRSRMRGNKGR